MASDDDGVQLPPSQGPEQPEPRQPEPETGDHKDPRGAKDSKDPREDTWARDDLSPEDRRRQVTERLKTRAATFGPGSAAFGRDQNQYFGDYHFYQSGKGHHWRTSAYDETARQRLRDRFVRPPFQDELDELVGTSSIVVLTGDRAAGRRAAALMALDQCCDQLNDAGWESAPGDLGQEDIAHRNGYVWDASDASWAEKLTGPDVFGCRRALERAEARLILLVTRDSHLDAAVRECAAQHRPADALEILRRFLRALLPDTELVDRVMSKISSAPGDPQRASELAHSLEAGISAALRDNADIDQAITDVLRRRQDYRVDARDVLRQKDGMPADKDLGRRAFMIAWAVLDGFSAAQICRAARELAERLFKIEARGRNARLSLLPFGDILDEWLRHAREDPPAYAEETDRRLQYRDGFAEAVLKAVWFDYVVAHKALLRWLKDLALDRDALVRVKAAKTLGQLAVYDFDYIVRHCFLRWSAGNQQALHDAAAWALEEVIRKSPAHTKRIFTLAEDWAKTGDLYRQSAAVRLVGAALGAQDPRRSLRLIRRVALRHPRNLDMSCAWSLVDMFVMGAEWPVIEQVSEWAHSPRPELRSLAARCLVELAYIDENGQPLLLAAFGRWPDQVTELWRRVLVSRVAGQEPWDVLRRWSRRRVDFTMLRVRLEAEDRLRGPMNFYLPKVASASGPPVKESVR